MARKRVVSRTLVVSDIHVMEYRPSTRTVEQETYSIVGDYPETKLKKMAEEKAKSDGMVIVEWLDIQRYEQLYGMTEEDFYKYAKRMDGYDGFANESEESK